jgi:hypothetical protein
MSSDELDRGGATQPTTGEASEHPSTLSRRKLLVGGASVAAAGGLAMGRVLRMRAPSDTLVAAAVDALPVTDPDDDAWNAARPARVPLEPQRMVPPFLTEATLAEVIVRALYDGRDLGLRLDWEDDEADEHDSIATFRDAAAVMLPAGPGGEEPPPIFMGWEDNRVYIAQWRASWQADLDAGFQDVEHLFPGWYSDVHHEHDTLVELGLDEETASPYAPGRDVGNPLSQRERTSPVEELTAEGYGSLAHSAEQRARGRGLYRDGRWHVAIEVPSGGPAPDLVAGSTVPVAFAVWHGGRRQVGGRKHHSQWSDLTLP